MTKQKTLFKDDPAKSKVQKDRDYQRNLMAKRRRVERDIRIDRSKINHRRRNRCKNRPDLFCRTYFPNIFYNPFTKDQKEIIESIKHRILYGGTQAIAAERGGGKTTITQIVGGVWAVVYGFIDFIVILRASGDDAKTTLASIKYYYETNEKLRNDFPEICDPIRALEGVVQRGKAQTAEGKQTYLKWADREIRFPIVADSAASGAIIICRGIDSSIRGLVVGNKRPKLVIADDVETKGTADSAVETKRRKEIIERDVMGLSGPGKSMAIVFLCTIINRRCIAFQYTDRKKNPQWNGIRQKWIKKFPKNADLWERYVYQRRDDLLAGDLFARTAHKFYLKHRKEMDAGALVSNRRRFEDVRLSDGSKLEVSSLQSAYNKIADQGLDFFKSEYQNDPPEEQEIDTIGLSKAAVMSRTSGIARGFVPDWCEYVTEGIDIGRRLIHRVIVGWGQGFRGHVIDYNTEPVHGPDGDHRDPEVMRQICDAILIALLRIRDWQRENSWKSESGGTDRPLDLALVDAGWQDMPVYAFCKSAVDKKYKPTKGFGTRQKSKFIVGKPSLSRRIGYHWIGSFQQGAKVWLYHVDADFWKQLIQGGFLLDPGSPGSLVLFGEDKIRHAEFARQICAEEWRREFKTGKGMIEGFHQIYANNHFLDALSLAAVAASMAGVHSIMSDGVTPGRKKISLKKIQELKKAGKL